MSDHPALGVDELEVTRSARGHGQPFQPAGLDHAFDELKFRPQGRVADRAQRRVSSVVEVPPDADVERDRRHDDHDDHGRRRRQGDPKAEAHAGRTTKPTPRTVWMSLLSPPSSVLRRRYPT